MVYVSHSNPLLALLSSLNSKAPLEFAHLHSTRTANVSAGPSIRSRDAAGSANVVPNLIEPTAAPWHTFEQRVVSFLPSGGDEAARSSSNASPSVRPGSGVIPPLRSVSPSQCTEVIPIFYCCHALLMLLGVTG